MAYQFTTGRSPLNLKRRISEAPITVIIAVVCRIAHALEIRKAAEQVATPSPRLTLRIGDRCRLCATFAVRQTSTLAAWGATRTATGGLSRTEKRPSLLGCRICAIDSSRIRAAVLSRSHHPRQLRLLKLNRTFQKAQAGGER